MTNLILIRHAETEANAQRIWNGSLDAPLTKRGEVQAAATAKRVVQLGQQAQFDAFYVSPLGRTQRTAAHITESTGMRPIIEEGLREFHLGDWEGRTLQDLHENEDLWGTWAKDPTFAPPNAESPVSFGTRAVNIIQTLADRHVDETVLIVTHGGIVANVLASWFGNGFSEWGQWSPHNCGIAMIKLAAGNWNGIAFNDINHLPQEAIVHR
ncbi:MAG: histidine phosphatase family protein [Chloroflexota bacterium]